MNGNLAERNPCTLHTELCTRHLVKGKTHWQEKKRPVSHFMMRNTDPLVEGKIVEKSTSPPDRRPTIKDLVNSKMEPRTRRESPSISNERACETSVRNNTTGEYGASATTKLNFWLWIFNLRNQWCSGTVAWSVQVYVWTIVHRC